MKSLIRVVILVVGAVCCWSAIYLQQPQHSDFYITDSTPLWDIMAKLGKIRPSPVDSNKRFSAEKGKALLETGHTVDFNGRLVPKLSKKFVCTTCHTNQKEHTSPVTVDAKTRLAYSDSMNIPFLPGAPFYGIVNRIAFFNDDFQSKYSGNYSQEFKKAHIGGLRQSIRSCNATFGQGREMADWEVESILAYFWEMQLTVGDLKVSTLDLAKVELAVETDENNARAVNLLRRYYNEIYPSHLAEPQKPEARRKTSPVLNNFTNGWRIYRWSCLHCHQNRRYADFRLDVAAKSFETLKKNFDENTRYSIYDVIRYHPGSKGNNSGMPLYTSERMSDQQIQDLRFFIIQMANMGEDAFAYFSGR